MLDLCVNMLAMTSTTKVLIAFTSFCPRFHPLLTISIISSLPQIIKADRATSCHLIPTARSCKKVAIYALNENFDFAFHLNPKEKRPRLAVSKIGLLSSYSFVHQLHSAPHTIMRHVFSIKNPPMNFLSFTPCAHIKTLTHTQVLEAQFHHNHNVFLFQHG